MRIIVLVIAGLLLLAHPVLADTIATCGPSQGYTYVANRKLGSEKTAGWSEDKIPKGQTSLIQDEKGEFDLLFLDATEKIFSARDDGAKIFPISLSEDALQLLAIYPLSSETYVFQKLKDDTFQLMWTQTKAEAPVVKIAGFVSKCDKFEIQKIKTKEKS